MIYKDTLFSREELNSMLPVPPVLQRDFETQNEQLLAAFPAIVSAALDRTWATAGTKPVDKWGAGWFATTVNANVKDGMNQEFPGRLELNVRNSCSFTFASDVEVHIKALKRKSFAPSYNTTKTSQTRCAGVSGNTDGSRPIVFLGYMLTKGKDAVAGCYAVCFKGNERLWVSDLSTLGGHGYGENPILLVAPTAPDPQPLVVTPKKRAATGTGG